MNLLPQDVFLMLKLVAAGQDKWTFDAIAHDLSMSPSMAFNGIKRADRAGLYDSHRRRPRRKALEEFLIHGVKYAYPPDLGTPTRGVPTTFAAPSLDQHLVQNDEATYVWAHPDGYRRGTSLSPLYRSVPDVAMQDPAVHHLLALVDAIRVGGARERQLAEQLLKKTLTRRS